MGLFAVFYGLLHKNKNSEDKRANYIFYKIVDSASPEEFFLQCINTKAIFRLKITEIVFDIDILHGLHPTQACYVGIEHSKHLKKENFSGSFGSKSQKLEKYSVFRYGKYNLRYQNRNGDLCFSSIKTDQEFIMDPRDIALSEELISEFDAAQAFYIGVLSGLKLNNPLHKVEPSKEFKRPRLRVVK